MSREKLYEVAREAYSRAKFYNLEEPVKAAVDAVLGEMEKDRATSEGYDLMGTAECFALWVDGPGSYLVWRDGE